MRTNAGDAPWIAAAFCAALLVLVPAHASATPDSTVVIGDVENGPGYPAVAIDGSGTPQLAWQAWRTGRLMAARLDVASGHVVGARAIDADGGAATWPHLRLVTSGSRVAAAWIDCCTVAAVSRSADAGVTFSSPLSAPATDPSGIDIAVDAAGTLYLTWEDQALLGAGRIAFATLPHDSTAFTPRRVVQETDGYTPAVAVAGGIVYVAWTTVRGVLMLNRSIDGGATFLPAVRVDPGTAEYQAFPRLAASAGRLFVLWGSHGNASGVRVRFTTTTDGSTFQTPVDLSGGIYVNLSDAGPTLAVGGDGLAYAAWSESLLGPESVSGVLRLRRGDANGGNWEDVRTISEANVRLLNPGIAVDAAGDFFLAYERYDPRTSAGAYGIRLATNLAFPSTADPALVGGLAIIVAAVAILGVAAIALLRPRRASRKEGTESAARRP